MWGGSSNDYYNQGLPSKPDPAFVNQSRDQDGNTYLHELCRKDAPLDLIKAAVKELKADINLLNKRGLPPLAIAIQNAKPETVALLIDLGAELHIPIAPKTNPKLNFNAAFMAAEAGKGGALEKILERGGGLYVNSPGVTRDGYPSDLLALHAAIKNYHPDLIAPLVKAGALVNEQTGYDNATPLNYAILNNNETAVKRLVDAGASLESRSNDGRTPLIYAASNRVGRAVMKLLELGADTEAQDNSGKTALMHAAQAGDYSACDYLLKAGAKPDARDAEGKTALMYAAQKGDGGVAKLLVREGADPLLADAFNRTAMRHAENTYGNGARWIIEEAEASALHKRFEKAYDAAKKKPGA
ncbi:MAG: ankyrin repeat domain-containing protein [Alphaproteobacteria bacterium]